VLAGAVEKGDDRVIRNLGFSDLFLNRGTQKTKNTDDTLIRNPVMILFQLKTNKLRKLENNKPISLSFYFFTKVEH
jgi:hypothetical protein